MINEIFIIAYFWNVPRREIADAIRLYDEKDFCTEWNKTRSQVMYSDYKEGFRIDASSTTPTIDRVECVVTPHKIKRVSQEGK